jgi:hypothetical protein
MDHRWITDGLQELAAMKAGAENTLTAEIRDKAWRNLELHALVKPSGPRSSTDIDGARG